MKKKHTWFYWIFIVTILVTVSWYFIKNSISINGHPWKMLPDTPSIILEIEQPEYTLSKLVENPIWKSLNNTLLFKRVSLRIIQLDSLLVKKQNYLNSIKSNPLLIAFYNNADSGLSTLFLSDIKLNIGNQSVKHLLSEKLGAGYAIIFTKIGKYALFRVIDVQHNMKYYFSIIDGVLAFSMNELQVEKAIEHYSNKNKTLEKATDIIKLRRYAGKKADAHFYFNYNELNKTLKLAANEKVKEACDFLQYFASWSETDLLIKDKELLLSGYTTCARQKNLFLNRFSKPENNSGLFNIIPFNTNIVLSLSGLNVNESKIKTTGIYISDISKLAVYLKNGLSLFENASNTINYKSRLYISIKVDKVGGLMKILRNISSISGVRNVVRYKNYKIRKNNFKKLWSIIIGEAFAGVTGNFYTQIGNYVVFANSLNAIESLIDYYESGKTMDLNENFKKISDNMQSNTNITLLIKPRMIAGLFSKYLNSKMLSAFKNNMETVDDFQNVLFQFSKENNQFYTNFYVQFNKSFHEENLAEWKVTLDDKIVRRPYLVKNFHNGLFDIIVFDKSNHIYLINGNGRILWKRKLKQIPISDIAQVDYYKNGKIQFLFNTTDDIYLIDRKGRFTGNYPYRLTPSATNGLSLFDYNKRKDYRILIAQADKRIYDYNIKGKMIKGWRKPKMENIVADKIQRLIANHKDYILITDIDNKVHIVNRRGKTRIRLKDDVNKAINSLFYLNVTNSKGIILTTDKKGRLTYISSSGRIHHTVFGKFSPEHYFLYEDFNGNGWKDFIFVDNRKLTVFNKFKKVLFSYQFQSNINTKPIFFTIGKGKRVLGITASEEKTIYLFDKNGNTLISKGLIGEIPFTVGSLKNNGQVNLITATSNVLYNYRIR